MATSLILASGPAWAGVPQSIDLSALSLEELGGIQVTSVSKRAEPASEAPSAIYVITHDEIIRSGAATLPEILRLAPNLQVAQTSANRYVVTARGMNGNPAVQSFANKLLVLIDGRSVYTPIFSGVSWDVQDVLPQDIDRIEVISGPGATLWGANAVNGVINITTRPASQTQGGFVEASAGDQQRSLSVRYGGAMGENVAYRVYARTVFQADTHTLAGTSAHDHASKPQAGFRLDWTPNIADSLTIQGDAYDGYNAQAGAPAVPVSGGNVLARWNRTFASGAALQVQTYYDRAARGAEVNGVASLTVETYDFDLQHSFVLGRHELVWGGGLRNSRYRIENTASLQFAPTSRSLRLGNLFVQDSITLNPDLRLIVGMKVEDDPYVSAVLLPNLRLSWNPGQGVSYWGAISRAVRSPTPLDRDVREFLGPTLFLVGGPRFQTEKLTAYEVGTRLQPTSRIALSVSAFYNRYDDLRSIELAPTGGLPLQWGNLMTGRTQGIEAWGDFQVTPWWRLSAAANVLDEKFRFKSGSAQLGGTRRQPGNDPKYQASLKSAMNLGPAFTLDAALRYVSALPDPRSPAYVELNGRFGWSLTEKVQLSVSGRNLLHDRHREYVQASAIPRSVFATLQWRF